MRDVRIGKWRFGIAVLLVVVLGLLGYVLYLGVQGKQDKATLRTAQTVADKLNGYVNSTQKVPDSLNQAGIKDVPSTISYTKKSSSSYEFCVTYKTANIDVGSDVQQGLTSAATNRMLGSGASGLTSSQLAVNATHKAGKQCQTVKAELFNFDNLFGGNGNAGSGSSDQFNFDSGGSSNYNDLFNSSTTDNSNLFNQ